MQSTPPKVIPYTEDELKALRVRAGLNEGDSSDDAGVIAAFGVKREYNPVVMEVPRQRIALEPADDSKDARLQKYPPLYGFRQLIDWSMGPGWADEVMTWLEASGIKVTVPSE